MRALAFSLARPAAAATARRPCAAAIRRPAPPRAGGRNAARGVDAAWASAAAGGPAGGGASPRPAGRIEIVTGPMFAGKSTELLKRVEAHKAAGRTVFLASSSKDDRYASGGAVVTHAGAAAPAAAVARLADLPPAAAAADVLAVDEAQFFDDLVAVVTEAADGRGQTVVVAGLDGDFLRRPFGGIPALAPHAESVTRLTARCSWCGGDAHFSVRTAGAGGAGAGAGAVAVGGAESYAAACRAHYNEARAGLDAPLGAAPVRPPSGAAAAAGDRTAV